MGLVGVFGDVGEMETEGLAETAELDLALVLETELERLLGDLLESDIRWCTCPPTEHRNCLRHAQSGSRRITGHDRACIRGIHEKYNTHLIDALQTSVIFQSLQRRPIALPQKLEPRRNKRPICPILALITTDRTQQDTLRRLRRLQVIDIDSSVRDGLVRLLLRLLDFRIGEGDKALDDDFDGSDACILGDVFILHQAFLRGPAFTHVDAELDEANHDGFEGGEGGRAKSFGGEHLREGLEGGMGLSYRDEALCLLQDRLRFRHGRHAGL